MQRRTKQAAEEAEAAVLYHCSVHGYVFVDTVNIAADDEGKTFNCKCNDCYTSQDCSQIAADWVVNADR